MATFLLKTEPSDYSFDRLISEKRCTWTGVKNAAALIHLRSIRKGDELFIYHTGDDKAIVGLAKALSNPYEDPAQPGKTPEGAPKAAVIDLAPVRKAKTPLTLAQIKADKRFAKLPLVTIGRLSVMPVLPEHDAAMRKLTGL